MKAKKGFVLRDVCGEKVVIAQGIENIDFSKLISLNESAAYLWKEIENKEFTEVELTKLLCKEYDVNEEQAAKDVEELIQTWKDQGIIEA